MHTEFYCRYQNFGQRETSLTTFRDRKIHGNQSTRAEAPPSALCSCCKPDAHGQQAFQLSNQIH